MYKRGRVASAEQKEMTMGLFNRTGGHGAGHGTHGGHGCCGGHAHGDVHEEARADQPGAGAPLVDGAKDPQPGAAAGPHAAHDDHAAHGGHPH